MEGRRIRARGARGVAGENPRQRRLQRRRVTVKVAVMSGAAGVRRARRARCSVPSPSHRRAETTSDWILPHELLHPENGHAVPHERNPRPVLERVADEIEQRLVVDVRAVVVALRLSVSVKSENRRSATCGDRRQVRLPEEIDRAGRRPQRATGDRATKPGAAARAGRRAIGPLCASTTGRAGRGRSTRRCARPDARRASDPTSINAAMRPAAIRAAAGGAGRRGDGVLFHLRPLEQSARRCAPAARAHRRADRA